MEVCGFLEMNALFHTKQESSRERGRWAAPSRVADPSHPIGKRWRNQIPSPLSKILGSLLWAETSSHLPSSLKLGVWVSRGFLSDCQSSDNSGLLLLSFSRSHTVQSILQLSFWLLLHHLLTYYADFLLFLRHTASYWWQANIEFIRD